MSYCPQCASYEARIAELQRERDNAFRAAREHAQASLDSVNRTEAAESRLARITQAADAMRDEYRRISQAGCKCEVCKAAKAYDAIRHTTEG